MKIINIEKLDGHKVFVITGRDEHVRKIAKHLEAVLYYAPRIEDHFTDYPKVVNELKDCVDSLINKRDIIMITTQSEEFLDCLLESDLDFMQVTVRNYDHDAADTYRLRVTPKEEALANRRVFRFEMRV